MSDDSSPHSASSAPTPDDPPKDLTEADGRSSDRTVTKTPLAPSAGTIQRQRGRDARRMGQIPAKGWRDILLRVKEEMKNDNVSLLAAGVAFYAMLALFPAIAALISIWGMVADPATIGEQVANFGSVLPSEAVKLVEEQMESIATSGDGKLTWGVVLGLLLSIWSATKGTRALITACNLAYDENEKRGWLSLNLLSLGMTAAGLVFVALAMGLLVALPVWAERFASNETTAIIATVLRWPLLFAAVSFALAVLYRYAPNRDKPRWSWVNWGSAIATILWLLGSAGFSFYVSNFGNYNKTYGAVGGVVVTMLWFYLSAFIIILGAELNSEAEHQTRRDTTSGTPEPMGQRDAYVADHLGEVP